MEPFSRAHSVAAAKNWFRLMPIIKSVQSSNMSSKVFSSIREKIVGGPDVGLIPNGCLTWSKSVDLATPWSWAAFRIDTFPDCTSFTAKCNWFIFNIWTYFFKEGDLKFHNMKKRISVVHCAIKKHFTHSSRVKEQRGSSSSAHCLYVMLPFLPDFPISWFPFFTNLYPEIPIKLDFRIFLHFFSIDWNQIGANLLEDTKDIRILKSVRKYPQKSLRPEIPGTPRTVHMPYGTYCAYAIRHVLCICHTARTAHMPYGTYCAYAIRHVLHTCHTARTVHMPYGTYCAYAIRHVLCICHTAQSVTNIIFQ